MADKTIDHEARAMASQANQRMDAHEEFCKERIRRAENFEADMRQGMDDLGRQIQSTMRRAHSRLDTLVRSALFGAVAVIIAGAGWALVQGITGS